MAVLMSMAICAVRNWLAHVDRVVRYQDRTRTCSDVGEPLDDIVEDGREEDPEEGHAEHPAEDGRPQRPTHLSSCALGEDERHDSEDEGERGHHDRTEP